MIELLNIDCMSYMKTCEDNAFDYVITSPPYNLSVKGKWGKWSGDLQNGYNTHSDDMPHEEYVAWQRDILSECWRLLSQKGAIFYNHKPRIKNGLLINPLEQCNHLPVRQVIIWARAGGIASSPGFYMNSHEYIILIPKPEFQLLEGKSGTLDVWSIAQTETSSIDHPAPFPIAIPKKILSTVPPGRILDPFSGSGTTAIAAHYFGCDFVGCEIDADYHAAAVARFNAETAQVDMFYET